MNLSLDRDRERESEGQMDLTYTFAVLLYGVEMLYSSFTLALPLFDGGQSFISFVLSISNSMLYIAIPIICVAVPSCQQKRETILGDEFFISASRWHCLHIRTCRVAWHFLMMHNIYLDLFMHEICDRTSEWKERASASIHIFEWHRCAFNTTAIPFSQLPMNLVIYSAAFPNKRINIHRNRVIAKKWVECCCCH